MNEQPQISDLDNEQEQLRRLDQWRRLIQLLLQKYLLFLGVAFLIILMGLTGVLYIHSRISPEQYRANIELLFQPKESDYFKPITDTTMLELFSRYQVARRTEEALQKLGFGHLASNYIDIQQKRDQRHLFSITAGGNTAEEAVVKAGTFAAICVEEYQKFRLADLANWESVIRQHRRETEEKIHATSSQIADLAKEAGITEPETEILRFRQTIAEQEQTLSELNIRQENALMRREKLELALKVIHPNVLLHAGKIKEYLRLLNENKNELLTANQLYTEKNPRLLALKERNAQIQKEYNDFLKEKGIRNFNPDTLDKFEKLRQELEDVVAEEELTRTNRNVLREELLHNKALLEKLAKLLPRLNQLKLLLNTYSKQLENMENRLTALNYLQSSVVGELQPIERIQEATKEDVFGKKQMALLLFASVFLTTVVAFAVVTIQLAFGKVQNKEELECYYGLIPLGTLSEGKTDDSALGKGYYVLSELYYHFYEMNPKARTIFIGCLDETALPYEELLESLQVLYAANGKRLIFIHMVSSQGFHEMPNAELLNFISHSGNTGYLPMENSTMLTGAEQNLLREDLKTLEKDYDAVILSGIAIGGPHQEILFQQMFNLCDASLLLVESGKTARRYLRRLLTIPHKKEQPFYSVLYCPRKGKVKK